MIHCTNMLNYLVIFTVLQQKLHCKSHDQCSFKSKILKIKSPYYCIKHKNIKVIDKNVNKIWIMTIGTVKNKKNAMITVSDSSILYVILPRLSPTRLKSRRTPALDKAEVLVARGKSSSTSRKSTKLGSVWRSGCLAMPFTNLSLTHKIPDLTMVWTFCPLSFVHN